METSSILYAVIFQILRPLVRILHRKGIAYREFSQIARQVYVETAESSLIEAGEKATTSRIAITTGLTRKDVAQLRQSEADNDMLGVQYNRGIRVISGWMGDSDFQDCKKEPAELVLNGDKNSFENLVRRYSGDIPYRAMLKELQQNNLVDITDDGKVVLVTNAYIPKGDESEKLSILGQDVGLLISTIDHNLQPPRDQQPYFQRKVSYDDIPRESVEQFRKMVNTDGMDMLIKFNDWLAGQGQPVETDANDVETVTIGVGVYYFEQ